MTPPLVISYYTSQYAEDAKRLRESCEAFGVECEIESVPDFPDWGAANSSKPDFIAAKMRQHPGRDVLWLDSDCWLKDRALIDTVAGSQFVRAHVTALKDIKPTMESWRYVARAYDAGKGIVNGGIVFVPHHRIGMVDEWRLCCELAPLDWDQWHLGQAAQILALPEEFRAGGPHVGHQSGFHRFWKRTTPRKVALFLHGSSTRYAEELAANGYWIALSGQSYGYQSPIIKLANLVYNSTDENSVDLLPWRHIATRAGSPHAALSIISEAAKANRPLRLLVIGMMPDALRGEVETAASATGADVDFLG